MVLVLSIVGIVAQNEDADQSAGTARADDVPTGADCRRGDGTDDTRNLCLYPDRPDQRAEDHEAAIGDAVRISGFTATLPGASIKRDRLIGDHLRVDAELANRDDRSQPYGAWQIGLQTADGVVIDPVLNPHEDRIPGGELIAGGHVEGSVVFDVGPGTYFLVYDPDLVETGRGIWRIEVD